MRKLKWICLSKSHNAVCMVFDDGSFLNVSHISEGIVYDQPDPDAVHDNMKKREYWARNWDKVVDVET